MARMQSENMSESENSAVPYIILNLSIPRKVLIKIKPSQVNIELGFIAALLPFADASFAKSVKVHN